jgi:uncharacterized protein (DUF1697 family)
MTKARMSTAVVDRRVALLRGINVGTAKRVSMADLRRVFEDLGYDDVRTLLNSGNVVFTIRKAASSDHAARVQKAIADRLGIRSRVVVLTQKDITDAIRTNPLKSVADNPSRLLVLAFADSSGPAQLEPLLKERWDPEALALGKHVAYLWCARGVGVSRLWTMVNRAIRDGGTARNMATMKRLLTILDE